MNDIEAYFLFSCEKGLKKRGKNGIKEYEERLKYETTIIRNMGYCGYFLVVSDMLDWALSQRIPVGPGRGSAAGALVSYVLYITHLDPIKYKLIFERFLNPSRISMPDIDLDLDEIRREEVIDYLKNKYGKDNVAHIGTFGKMKAKAAIRDVCRTLGFDYNVGDKLSRLTLDPIAGKPQPLIECYDKVPELKNLRYGEDCPEKTILSWAEKIEDKEKSFGTHASGILISPTPIKEIVPLYPGLNGKATTQYDMNIVDQVGLTKFDLLGLRALTTIDKCINLIYQRKGIKLNSLELPVDDKKTFKTLQRGDTVGLFQLESSGMRDLVVQIRPTKLEDIGVLVAIYRPGPLSSEGFKHYLEVRKGEASPHYLIPELEPILEDTDGFMIYQEQVLEICKQLAGYSLAEADLMRKAIGKKLDKEMNDQEKKFKQGLYNSNISEHIANQLWNDIKAFSDYSFNRCLTGDTKVKTIKNKEISINEIKTKIENKEKISLLSYNKKKKETFFDECLEVIDTGIQDVYEITFEDGSIVSSTLNHKFLCIDNKYHTLKEIIEKNLDIISIKDIVLTEDTQYRRD